MSTTSQIRYSRLGFQLFAWIFLISIVIQTFLAGLAMFTDYTFWGYHTTFVVWFQFIPLVLLILTFTGKLPKSLRWQCIGIFLLIVPLQYMSIHIPNLGAVHPVIALLLFWLT